MSQFEIKPASTGCYHAISIMVGELLHEIMDAVNEPAFNYDEKKSEQRAKDLIESGKYWSFLAWHDDQPIGLITLYESYALYAEGAFGTIPELYVRSPWRSNKVGNLLLNRAFEFAREKGWHRLEVTTPPLPEFDRSLDFYEKNGFVISGGRKLKIDIEGTIEP
ncbi:MAG: GNAT family N-acetyltransferase [Sedimenticola sp.]